MSWVDEVVLPKAFEELVRLKADPEVIRLVRLGMGTPAYVLEAEEAAVAEEPAAEPPVEEVHA